MRCLIIHNPASGPSSDEIFAFTHALAQGGDEVVMRFIGDGMEPEDAVADVREFDRVVVSGGDGTVSNVLDQMRGCGVPTLVFPSGTACLFFNNIGNAPEAAALAKACRAGRTVKVDMGELFWLDENGNEKRHGLHHHRRLGLRRRDHDEGRPHQKRHRRDRLLPLCARHAQPYGSALYD